jgi:peroxiredoxin
MNKLILLLLLPVAGFSQSAKEFKIKGDLDLVKQVDWVYLRYQSNGELVLDSIQPKNGEFKFEGKMAEPTLASLIVKYVKGPADAKAKTENMQFFMEPSKIEIHAKDSLKANTVTGSVGQADFANFQKLEEPYGDKFRALYKDYDRLQKEGKKDSLQLIEDQSEALQKELNEKIYGSFVKAHPNSTAALYALKQYAGWDVDPAKVEPLFNSLPAEVRAYPSAEMLKFQIETAKKTAIGNYAMDFTQNDTLGKPVSLSSFKGKYVLVDFWASWCGPCRAENPNVVKAFNKYKDRNFTIIGVSLDRPNAKDRWIKAIHDDGLTWNHVSDLKFWDNAVAKQYAIRAIPQNLLIDPQGKIVAKNLNGEELAKKLSEYLQ